MTDRDVLADLVSYIAKETRLLLTDMSPEELAWQPDAQGNSIGVTVWHYSRWLDLLVVRLLENRPAEEEQWHTQGWAANTGYDPRGIGFRGLGAITGYTQQEVAAIPLLSGEDLLTYLDQVCSALRGHLLSMPEGTLSSAARGYPKGTAYQTIMGPVLGSIGHLGEIEALKVLQERARL
ncbi:MAG TPA: DinB family protein [Ktedonosporobacter sp.]|nr:DinB family protein [Ktedonosporobacter sp.]